MIGNPSGYCFAGVAPRDVPSPAAKAAGTLAGLAAAAVLAFAPAPALAENNVRLPPLDRDPQRCERAYTGNTIGQANAVSDRILDLRYCDFTNKNLSGKTLSGALLLGADLTGANLSEVVMSKAYAVEANFSGSNLTNAVVDRVAFERSNLTGERPAGCRVAAHRF